MAELLAIPAAAIAFSQAADRLGGLLSKASRLLEAPEEVSFLADQVERWKAMLEALRSGQERYSASGLDDSYGLQGSACACEKLIKVTQELLKYKLVKKSSGESGEEHEARRLHSARKKGKVENLKQRIGSEVQLMSL